MFYPSFPPFSAVKCPEVSAPDYGTISPIGAQFTYGSEIVVTCVAGYRVIGSAKRRCQADGAWSGHDPLCQGMDGYALSLVPSHFTK